MKRPAAALVLGLIVLAASACTPNGASPQSPTSTALITSRPVAATGSDAATGAAGVGSKPGGTGTKVLDSFGNVDFYTTVAGDSYAHLSKDYHLSQAKIEAFNNLTPGAPLTPGTKLRLIPPPGPIKAAMGVATADGNGIPLTYTVVQDDGIQGITYRFGITSDQLAEANKVPYVYSVGNRDFLHPGMVLQLQKNPVYRRAGSGKITANSFGHADYYVTVDGDSFDSLGYRFRCTTDELLRYNPGLVPGAPIPAGTRVSVMPGDATLNGAQGSFTSGPDGIPLTYTTAPGDLEFQVAARFNMETAELETANRPLVEGGRVWFDFADLPNDVLSPGQTISLDSHHPIRK
ncbi:MAG TPA: LysM peptidoglycan-binding domain-containing protein [Micrococcaceae bacterium]|jgi:LysM repeat protein|nr:LysM peptidoglycan-binding domain-containing protein [Micrococcaceae bacterium]